MTDIFFKNSWAILQNPHCPGTRSHHAWNVWLRVARGGLIGNYDIFDAPGKEFDNLSHKCGRNSGPQSPYTPKIYRYSRMVTTESLI